MEHINTKEMFISRIKMKPNISKAEKIVLYFMSFNIDSIIRSEVAKLLCTYDYSVVIERILYRMTYDRDYIVKLEAIDSLCIARQTRSLQRVENLTKEKDCLLRAYAYMSLIDIVENRNIVSEKQYYTEWIAKRIWKEKSFKVRFMVMSELYINGQNDYWKEIVRMIDYQIKKGLSEFWLITNVLESVAVIDKQEEILDILQRMKQQTEIRSQKERIEELEKMI